MVTKLWTPRHLVPSRHVYGHLSLRLLLAYVAMGVSVFGTGWDNVLYNTIQAMPGRYTNDMSTRALRT